MFAGEVFQAEASLSVGRGLFPDQTSSISIQTAGSLYTILIISLKQHSNSQRTKNYNSDWLCLKSWFSIALWGPMWLLIFSFWKDGSGGIFPKLWCRTGQTLRSQRLHGGRSGSGKFVLLGSSFCFGGHKIIDHLAWLLLYLQVKVPLMSEPQGDWFTSQPASPACFCRFLIKVNFKIWKTLSTLMVS